MADKKIRIAFVCEFDMNDPNERSGVPYFIAQGFKNMGHELVQIGPFQNKRSFTARIKNAFLVLLFNTLAKGRWGWINNQWSKEFLRNYAVQTEQKLASLNVDLVFSPESHTIAYLNTSIPIVFWRDASFANLLNYYPEFSQIHPISIQQGHASEIEALKRTSLAVYTSDWAANSALNDYHADPKKLLVVERGANFLIPPQKDIVEKAIQAKLASSVLRILFIAGNWERKGGDLTFKTVQLLREKGIFTELHVVGVPPIIKGSTPDWVVYHGYIKKSSEEGRATLQALYDSCHFFMMPSLAENFGIVYAEASAQGLPSIASATGGVSSAVRHGKNGLLFTANASAQEIQNEVQQLWSNKDAFLSLCRDTRKEYEERLNWERNCARVMERISVLLSKE